MKIYVVGHSKYYASWIEHEQITNSPEDADLLLFTGGEDVFPAFYNESVGKFTHFNRERDKREFKVFMENKDKPKLGICRGSQFLTVMNKGKLIQHVNNHGIGGTHSITTKTGETYEITSTHHQMMNPYGLSLKEYELIAWSSQKRATTYLDGNNNEIENFNDPNFLEPEIVWYPKTKSLAIQGHPETMAKGKIHTYLNNLLKEKICL